MPAGASAASSWRPTQARPLHLDVALESCLANHPGANGPAVRSHVFDGVEQPAVALRGDGDGGADQGRRAGFDASLRVAREPPQQGHEVAFLVRLGWLATWRPQRHPAARAQAIPRLRCGDPGDLVGVRLLRRVGVEKDSEVLDAGRFELANDELEPARGAVTAASSSRTNGWARSDVNRGSTSATSPSFPRLILLNRPSGSPLWSHQSLISTAPRRDGCSCSCSMWPADLRTTPAATDIDIAPTLPYARAGPRVPRELPMAILIRRRSSSNGSSGATSSASPSA